MTIGSELTRARLIIGNGDVVAMLEDALQRARDGEIEVVCLCACSPDAGVTWGWAVKPDAPHAWARLLSAVASAQHDLLMDGL